MKKYINMLEKAHPGADVLSLPDKYKILDSVLAETRQLRLAVGLFAFIVGAVVAGVAMGLLQLPLPELLMYVITGFVSVAFAVLGCTASQRVILSRHIFKKYNKG